MTRFLREGGTAEERGVSGFFGTGASDTGVKTGELTANIMQLTIRAT